MQIYETTYDRLALFPGPAQLSVACSTEKRGEPGIFSHVSKLQKFAELTGCVSRIGNQLRTQRSVCKTIASH